MRTILLQIQKISFQFEPSRVAGEGSVFAYDPVTGDEEPDRVSPDGRAHGADGGRSADFCGNVRIGAGLPEGDAQKCVPDLLLEVCSLRGKRKSDGEGAAGKIGA